MEYIPLFIILLNLTQAIFSVPIGRLVRILGAKIVFVIALLFEIFAVIFLYYGILSAAFFFARRSAFARPARSRRSSRKA